MSRHEGPSSYPFEAPRGPIVAITDEYAMSGGDIVIQALKSYGIATIVGTRTWGGVIGCYFNELVDGTLVTQPASACGLPTSAGRWRTTERIRTSR